MKFYPAVFLANAMAAFILNLVRRATRPLRTAAEQQSQTLVLVVDRHDMASRA